MMGMVVAALLATGLASGQSLYFEIEPLPGLSVERGHALNGVATGPFLQGDFNGDGATDLLLPDAVVFQTDGRFHRDGREPLPIGAERPFADAWASELFLFYPDRLEILAWGGDAFGRVRTQPMIWPPAFAATTPDPQLQGAGDVLQATPRVAIRRLLHDLTGDGVPEIVVATPEGLAVFRADADGRYGAAETLAVFPPLRLARPPSLALWPPQERRVAFPARQMASRFLVEQGAVTTIERTDSSAQSARYIVTRFTVAPGDDGTLRAVEVASDTTPPVSHALRPWRLNEGSDALHFAGGDLMQTRASLVPAPLYATLASTDGGESIQEIRSLSFRPALSFVDFNGNGNLDLVAHHTGLFEGGARDIVARALSERRMTHRVAVHLQEDGRFAREPAYTGRFTIALDQPPSRYTPHFARYQEASLIDLGGDIDGSGLKDAVVQAAPNRLYVYRAVPGGFFGSPAAVIPIDPDEDFVALDLTGNGQAEIVLQARVRPGDAPAEGATRVVYFTRDGSE